MELNKLPYRCPDDENKKCPELQEKDILRKKNVDLKHELNNTKKDLKFNVIMSVFCILSLGTLYTCSDSKKEELALQVEKLKKANLEEKAIRQKIIGEVEKVLGCKIELNGKEVKIIVNGEEKVETVPGQEIKKDNTEI